MSRKILFRGKRIDNGEWIDGSLVIKGTQYFIFTGETKNFRGMINWVWYEVDLETVCEYTGLTNKNGRKIFENDIVGIYREYRKEWDYGVVKYGEFNCSCCSGVYGWHFAEEDIRRYDEYEVIGNIFDNPELLGGGKAE